MKIKNKKKYHNNNKNNKNNKNNNVKCFLKEIVKDNVFIKDFFQ